MGKKKKDKKQTPKRTQKPIRANPPEVMNIDGILAQLSSLADNSRSFITGKSEDDEFDEIWKADIKALEQATAILSAIQDEGIRDPEQVHDLIADYNAMADERREMYRKYEHPDPPISKGSQTVCPECNTPLRFHPRHCPECGKRLNHENQGRKKRD